VSVPSLRPCTLRPCVLLGVLFGILWSAGAAADTIDRNVRFLTRSEDFKVRLKAATNLSKRKDKRAVDALVVALEDPHRLVRAAAANSLGKLAMRDALPALCTARADRDTLAKKEILKAIGSLGGEAGCTASRIYFRLLVNGEDPDLVRYVETEILKKAAADERLALEARAVDLGVGADTTTAKDWKAEADAGRVPGVELHLNLVSEVTRGAANTKLHCEVRQAYFKYRPRALRGNAKHAADIELGTANVNERAIAGQMRECLGALVPHVYEGFAQYVDGVR
jgi:hypothetical protein